MRHCGLGLRGRWVGQHFANLAIFTCQMLQVRFGPPTPRRPESIFGLRQIKLRHCVECRISHYSVRIQVMCLCKGGWLNSLAKVQHSQSKGYVDDSPPDRAAP